MSTHDYKQPSGNEPNASSENEFKSALQKRRSPWASSYHAIKYVTALPRDNFRTTDRITEVMIFCCLLIAALLIFLPTSFLSPPVVLLSDLIFFTITVLFIVKRLGILITLNERQAVLVWDIVVGALILGIILSFNGMMFINYLTQISPKH